MNRFSMSLILLSLVLNSCTKLAYGQNRDAGAKASTQLPEPFATKSTIKHPKVIGWPKDKSPSVPVGFRVDAFTRELENPRWIYVLPNGDVLIAQSRTLPKPADEEKDDSEKTEKEKKQEEGAKQAKTVTGSSPNKITLLRDANNDGQPELVETFLSDLRQPFGMALVEDQLFVAETDALRVYPYKEGDSKITAKGMKILDLPAGGYNNHWTRNVVANPRGTKLYVSVGSASNVGEHGSAEETLRANILEVDLDGTNLRVFAAGLRNPVGMSWEPKTGSLWTAVNERDELGDDLVPDYITSVREGAFYGWPYSYFGQHEDPRRKDERPDLVKKAVVPDLGLGSHTASLGLAFYTGKTFPSKYQGGAFIGQRGSWNRSKFVGYRVAFVPFAGGKPAGPPEDFLAGFIANDEEVYGRPVGVAVAKDGSLLVCDEPGNVVWRVSAK
ncbi:Membrane bound L-sorbosone dehydrogenase [Anatilimnocola aggregata]|uniref:Membrane bound L-sorbosone dehydrogenase n=1 Tax=Anatilimnocola aggregata TaxID=2528021 RepID=A0A517Y5B4_9BACT|nr:sorbosone dehydrogenase family protein [Anatilimnocola aggregata]QDU25312.1 Membrane bound L-sorbosone dehydrogenase [Anatilimnocola aggregata]